MNLVGQLAETVFVTVKELYRGLNPATLTGGIDVIVVRQPDGSFQCSPFHVRFGKLGVLRSKEKIVDIEINGDPVDLHMKLGDNGEAFFVEENENIGSHLPAHLCTSPIPLEIPEGMEASTQGSSVAVPGTRRKKRRRKRIRSDNHAREADRSSSEERDKEWESETGLESPPKEQPVSQLQVSKSVYYSLSEEPFEDVEATQSRDTHPHSDGEHSPTESNVFCSRPSSPKSDSELVLGPHDPNGPQMQWNWGGFPTLCQSQKTSPGSPSSSCFRTIERQDSFDLGCEPIISYHQSLLSVDVDQALIGSAPVSERDRGTEPRAERGEDDSGPGSPGGSQTSKSAQTDVTWAPAEPQDKKKGKRNHHLGPADIYLDDLTTLDPEVAVLYFPKSETEPSSVNQGSFSSSQSPQSVGSGAMDSGAEYLSDSNSYNMDLSMSLCGQESDTRQITKERFMEHIVTYQDFANNPGIIEDPSLVICINSKYYNWAVAAPMILSMTAFQKNLPKSTVERLVKDKMPKKSGRWWFSWRRRRDMSRSEVRAQTLNPKLVQVLQTYLMMHLSSEAPDQSAKSLSTAQCINQIYRKSLRLTSQQIEKLNLREGPNKVMFSVTTQYQGTCRCEATIYLWNWDDRIVISDIDGTITKSDALGHILPQFGKDWTHKGIAKLYHNIHQNGYKFLYCSARAIGMAAITKDYLQWVNDRGTVLPKGPVLLAPSSLFSALHREVIEKKPEIFKIACLNDIRDLFNPKRQPFYAAFGNRTNDAYAYKQVGVPDTHLFTVNPKGELIQEKTKANKSSYSHLSELVEHFFPLVYTKGSSCALQCPEYSTVTFWRDPLPELDL
ncbi:unnamed protein product, partial [Tetraodon nigroviridis]